MTKWIEQMSLEFLANGTRHPYGDDMKQSFEAGATDMRDKVNEIVKSIEANYPEDIFEPLKKDEIMPSRDRVSAQMARHVCNLILKELEEL